jgi:hypothetical protein
MLVAWSATRSRLRQIISAFSACGANVALLFHHLGQRLVGGAIHGIHGVVHGEHGARHFGIGLNERLQALAHHVRGQRRHARNVHGQIDHGHLLHVPRTRSLMLLAASPTRSRSALILITPG